MARFGRSYGRTVIIKTKVGRHYASDLSESITASETLTKAITRTITESVLTATSAVSTMFTKLIEASETTLTATETIIKAIGKSLNESSTLTETFAKAHGWVRSFSETDIVNTDSNITFARGSAMSETSITVSEYFKIYKNGISVLWTKVAKQAAGTWTKVAKVVGTWTKQPKP
jgi:hypothetical protein